MSTPSSSTSVPSAVKTAATTASAPAMMSSRPKTMPRTLSPVEQQVEERGGTGLVERVVLVAALGRLDAGRAAVLAGARRDRVAGGGEPGARRAEAALGEAGSARVAVVDEDGELAGVRMDRGRHTADVPAVAGREERQQPDRAVLGRVGGPGQVGPGEPGLGQRVLRHRPPDRGRAQRALRE